MYRNIIFNWSYCFILTWVLFGCNNDIETEVKQTPVQESPFPKTISVAFAQTDDANSRLAYEEYGTLGSMGIKTTWENTDKVTVNLLSNLHYAIYKINDGIGTAQATFTVDTDNYNISTGLIKFTHFGVYYPSTITSDQAFFDFSYENQTQNGNNSISHIKQFHCARTLEVYSSGQSFSGVIDFSSEGALQSSCMKFMLKDFPSMNPTKITLMKMDSNGFFTDAFYTTNYPNGIYSAYLSASNTNKLSLNLTNIGNTTSVNAYMMMSCAPIQLKSGEKFRVVIEDGTKKYYSDKAINSNAVLNTGRLHVISISGTDNWKELNLPSSSESDYQTYDAKVTTLQTANAANITQGTDLIIMGDGFIGEDFANGTYQEAMSNAYDDFFSVEPLKSLKDHFNVYYVNAVSENRLYIDNQMNGAQSTQPSITKFSTFFVPGSTQVGGNDNLVLEYAKKALGTNANTRIQTAQILVVVNANCHAGTCYTAYNLESKKDYGEFHGIAYCTMYSNKESRRLTLVHEAVGHGFGKLADEYGEGSGSYYSNPSSKWDELKTFHTIGHHKNVDKYTTDITTINDVFWNNLYSTYGTSESLGVYEGAYTVFKDFCRPTPNSVMNNQFTNNSEDGYYRFNAISRWTIWYRLMCLTTNNYGGLISDNSFANSLDDFLNWDSAHKDVIPSNYNMSYSARSILEGNQVPSTPPVLILGRWENGRFITE